jgi:phosphopantetheinyl transferase
LPLILEENIKNSIIIGVWRITESLGELEADYILPPSDLDEINNTNLHKRKIEKYITRLLAKQILEKHFNQKYQGLLRLETGKPKLINLPLEISVSHCENYLSVLISNNDKAGIDLQNLNDKIEKVSKRIFSEDELNQIGDDKQLLARAWSAKEAMFKYYEKGQINFKRDLHLKNITDSNSFYGILFRDKKEYKINLGTIQLSKSYQLVYCFEK